ncbi:MAG: hypothetical protein R3230_05305 [Nitrosopumilaceae archaeon]|nr:hypothetical protein [Nitrosopumilaceae archaeon]
MNQAQTQRSLANVCLFCNEVVSPPKMCKFCGFKFCDDHMETDKHQCIKTRYVELIKRTDKTPNVANGFFKVVCNVCGYVSKKPTPIEYAGEELTQHTQMIGCANNIFLEETNPNDEDLDKIELKQSSDDNSHEESTVEQILKLSSFKEKGMISEDEFNFIKKELIKKLKE